MPRRGEDDEVLDARHDLRRRDVGDGHLLAVIEEGVLVDVYPGLVDAAAGEGVADPLGDHHCYHDGEDVGQGAGELEHDDDDGHRQAGDAGEGGRRSDNCVCSRRDAGNVWFAGLEEEEARIAVKPHLHEDAHGSANECADGHGW